MNILVVNNMAPFVWGGAEELAAHLLKNLRAANVNAELLRIPFTWDPAERLLEEILLCRSLRLSNVDRVIALKFPAYLIPHENKTFWLLHQYRQAYDLWDAGLSNIPENARGEEIRRVIQSADNKAFNTGKKIFVNSPVTKERLRKYNGFSSEVLMPPLNDPHLFDNKEYGNYIFAGGRINSAKRQHLLLEAMRWVKSPIQLIIAGPPDSLHDAETLQNCIKENHLQDRVKLDLRFLGRDELANYVNNSLACAYLPIDEDSVGYVTMEAFCASKAVITCHDSGGLLEIVKQGETGLLCEPCPKMLAENIEYMSNNIQKTKEMGAAAKNLWDEKNITWPATIERILA